MLCLYASSTFEYEDNYDDDGLDFNKDAGGQEDLDGEEDAKYGDLDEIDTEGAFLSKWKTESAFFMILVP